MARNDTEGETIKNKNQKIKLVQIIADSNIGGGPTHVLSILRNLDKEKFDCYLVCPSGYLSEEAKAISKVTVINVPMNSKFDLPSIFKLKSELRKIQADGDPFGPMIIHSHGPRGGLMAHLASPKGVKSVYTEHIYDESYRIKNPFNAWIQKSLLKNQNSKRDLIIAVSNSVKDYLVKSGLAKKEQTLVIPNGIDFENLKFKIQNLKKSGNSASIIGAIGNLNRNKGHEYLIEAVAVIKKKYPLISLEIIGEGPERANLTAKIKVLELEHNVTLLGSKKDAYKYLKHWRACVLPSVSEPFGIVILEAMAFGVPIVASRVGGIVDIITDKKNGLLVPPRNPDKIASAVLEILQHPVLAAKLRREGMLRAKDFDWKDIAKRLEEAYISLLDGGK